MGRWEVRGSLLFFSGFLVLVLFFRRYRWFYGAITEILYTCEKGVCCIGGGVEWGWVVRRG